MVAISSTLREDLYVVYAGTSPDTNLPGDPCVFESAGEVDLAGWRRRGVWELFWRFCRIGRLLW